MDQVRHVVVLMQENRSFDHYFGSLRGVRGFDDRQALVFPDGNSVFRQPTPSRDDDVLLPFRMDTGRYRAQHLDELPHDWESGHDAINRGAMNRWTSAKGEYTMGYFTREDLPYQYALADAFTIGDAYFCSLAGPTSPNRLYLWSGTSGPGRDGTTGPWIDNTPMPQTPVCDWTTYAERLSAAGVSWRVYHTPGTDEREGNYDDNALEYFAQFQGFDADDQRHRDAMTRWDLDAFAEHCLDGTLPTVSWLVAPYLFCEHPNASPAYGAHYVDTALRALFANPEVWRHTVFLVMYDENDGFFDHVVPPTPPVGTPDEFVDGHAIGLGNRVPLFAISPWSRGGWASSQVFDHTSVLQFLERVTGVAEPNISAWRRTVCGDLSSCFDFEHPDYSIPELPDTVELMARADASAALPPVPIPASGSQSMPSQEPGDRPHRPLPYRPWADVEVDASTGAVTCALLNDGAVGYPFTVYPNAIRPFSGTPYAVPPGANETFVWDTIRTAGRYDFTVHGPDGFVARFAGDVPRDTTGGPAVSAELLGSTHDEARIVLTLENGGAATAVFVLADEEGTDVSEHEVVAGGRVELLRAVDEGVYDLTVAVGATGFLRRYAGTVHPMPASRAARPA